MFINIAGAMVQKEGNLIMSIVLRVILVISSVLTCSYVSRKLKKSQVQIMDTVFWLALSAMFIILAIFPQVASYVSRMLGFQAPVNFIFLLMIFLLLIRCFLLSIRISQLDDKIQKLVQEMAIRDKLIEDNKN